MSLKETEKEGKNFWKEMNLILIQKELEAKEEEVLLEKDEFLGC